MLVPLPLGVTYTKAAAAELRGKIAAELAKRMAQNPGDIIKRYIFCRKFKQSFEN